MRRPATAAPPRPRARRRAEGRTGARGARQRAQPGAGCSTRPWGRRQWPPTGARGGGCGRGPTRRRPTARPRAGDRPMPPSEVPAVRRSARGGSGGARPPPPAVIAFDGRRAAAGPPVRRPTPVGQIARPTALPIARPLICPARTRGRGGQVPAKAEGRSRVYRLSRVTPSQMSIGMRTHRHGPGASQAQLGKGALRTPCPRAPSDPASKSDSVSRPVGLGTPRFSHGSMSGTSSGRTNYCPFGA